MHIIEFKQNVPISLSACWDFFAAPINLTVLTPPYLGFSENSDGRPMYEGQIIIHHVKPFWGLSWQWVTEITHVKLLHYFIDEQRIGPYKFWHHEHRFHENSHGVEIVDRIHYVLPWGVFGKAINHVKVRRDLDLIFAYRQNKIMEIFGTC